MPIFSNCALVEGIFLPLHCSRQSGYVPSGSPCDLSPCLSSWPCSMPLDWFHPGHSYFISTLVNLIFPSQPGHYFPIPFSECCGKQQKKQDPGLAIFFLLPWIIFQICSIRLGGKKQKVFPAETWGQTGILENFRGTGKVKAEYLATLVKKNASSRLKPLL